ncbi:metallophosphoesterase [Sphingomonas sp. GlSt437]|uniref:metallophosphoesterase n=1 Tax=Sphingomonas sp. GlSt437 TaxID=3389970 RepID=UPI003EB6AC11
MRGATGMRMAFNPFRRNRSTGAAPARYRLPAGLRVYAIGDVHGRFDCLLQIERAIARDHGLRAPVEQALVIFLGDYVDRGLSSREVLERLTQPGFAGLPARYLIGNHEDAMLRFLAEPRDTAAWLNWGGAATLASYGIAISPTPTPAQLTAAGRALAAALPKAHHDFLVRLELAIELGDFAFVHAGIRPGIALNRQRRADLLEIREPFLSSEALHPRRIVHGHTVTADPVIFANRISIDTGAYATGRLTAAVIEDDRVDILTN